MHTYIHTYVCTFIQYTKAQENNLFICFLFEFVVIANDKSNAREKRAY